MGSVSLDHPEEGFTTLHTERGAVLVLFVLLLIVIIAMVALAIDSTILGSAKQQHQEATDFAVLAALETYSARRSAGDLPADALNAAADRASKLMTQQYGSAVARSLAVDKSQEPDQIGTVGMRGTNGYLVPGQWFFSDPGCGTPGPFHNLPNVPPGFEGGSSCPCDGGSTFQGACFRPVEATTAGNALRLNYETSPPTDLRALIGKLLPNAAPQHLQSISEATLVSRNAIYLLDLSPSMVEDSHPKTFLDPGCIPTTPQDPPKKTPDLCVPQYAYMVRYPQACNPTPSNLDRSQGTQTLWDYFLNPPRRDNFTRCSTINFTKENGSPRTERYWVDQVISPEPLASVLGGIHTSMDSFLKRQVPGDRVGVLGFDSQLLPSRILRDPANPIRPIAVPTSLAPYSEQDAFRDFIDATNMSQYPQPPGHETLISKFLFPRLLDDSGERANTDLTTSLQTARRMIKNVSGWEASQNFVVMFSDGIGNCTNSGSPRCRSDLPNFSTYYNASKTEILEELSGYASDRITFHMFLTGQVVQPHVLAYSAPGGAPRCMTQDEIESAGYNLVDQSGGTYNSPPWHDPNWLYNGVKATGGIWAPLRPCHPKLGKCGTQAAAFPTAGPSGFDAACGSIINPPFSNPGASADRSGSSMSIPFWDSDGRIIYDPLGRSTSQQVQAYMNQILSKAPFILVRRGFD